MAYKLLLKPGAEEDIDTAYNWYEEKKQGLGEESLTELVAFYAKLQSHPTAFGKIKKTYRQVALKRFPFVIVYEIVKTEVVVFAVFHTSRNPKYKFRD